MQELDIVGLVFRPGTAVLAIAIYALTFLLRRSIEIVFPSLRKASDANAPGATYLTKMSRWWNEVILYFMPVVLGFLLALVRSDFFFSGIADRGGRLVFGAVVGWCSSAVYKLLWKVIKQAKGLEADAAIAEPGTGSPIGG